jgi:sugar transferase (PEP-CTERM system associated)
LIRVFNSYVPSRTVVLLCGEVAVICLSFSLAIFLRYGQDSILVLKYEHGMWKILVVTALAMLCAHYLEMYDLQRLQSPGETYFRILTLVGTLAFLLAGLTLVFPRLLVGRNVFLTGLIILSLMWVLWRWAFGHLIFLPAFRERVYLLGDGERAKRIMEAVRTRGELGMDIIGWANEGKSEALGKVLRDLGDHTNVDRVIVALKDRRTTMPVNELLDLRLSGVRIEDGTTLLERISGQIEVDELHPSWLIFGDGFRLGERHWYLRRVFSTLLALALCLVTAPFIPIIALIVKLSSPGPVLYRQQRVGLRGKAFTCYKFRTMRQDAEAGGAKWATDDDPRITRTGNFMRRTRMDEIPQFWNVLRGDMAFVGPRPERPEFVEKLNQEIPYYYLRHMARPGITGWAQVNYGYGSSVEESKEKLRYDLYYIRNISLTLDLLIAFYTVRAVMVGRGVR